VVFLCPFLGECNEENEEAACFDAGHADRSDQPGTVQNEFYLPASVPAVFLHGVEIVP
jgi:NADH:ubiquinone oxidoreductase subunit 3 (subunit A)